MAKDVEAETQLIQDLHHESYVASDRMKLPRERRRRDSRVVGWKKKDNRANLLFGRCFELALGAYFRREDSAAALFAEWAKYREADIEFSHGHTWDRMFRQGVQLLERLAQYDRIEITGHVHGNWCSTHSSYFIDWRSEDLSSFE